MGIFGQKKDPAVQLQETIQKLGLDIQQLSKESINSENEKNIKQIATDLSNAKLMGIGAALSGGRGDLVAISGYLKATVNQNWILIRQNELILRGLKKK